MMNYYYDLIIILLRAKGDIKLGEKERIETDEE